MTWRRRDVLIAAAAGIAATAAGFLAGPLFLQSSSGVARLLRMRFTDLKGAPHTLAEWSGRVLVCNFWAAWCPPCVREVPLLSAVQTKLAPNGLQIVGIALDTAANVEQFKLRIPISYPVLIAGADGFDLLHALGNRPGGLPYTVVLDRHGALVGHKLGEFVSPAQLETLVKPLLVA